MKMNKYFIALICCMLFLKNSVVAQVEKVIVETFYVSDSFDETDTIDGSSRRLPAGSKTYRVYVDMVKGSKLVKMYGNGAHALKITSTDTFFNNIDRPTEYFGYLINKAYFGGNPTLALDSWITLGLASKIHYGVLKSQDTDGSVIGGTHNGGGTASIPGGLLINNDPLAGIPITSEDGFLPNTVTYSTWFDNGFKDMSNVDTTVFGTVKRGSQFVSNSAFLQQNAGVSGAIPDSNQVLVAQLTTKGTISFALNLQILDSAGNTINYVAQSNSTPTGDTLLSPYLTYPPLCGCRDTRYLEYDPSYACNNASACVTLKIFGCTDTMACNYNPSANVLLPNFCCYPGYCNDRDIGLVCPGIHPRLTQQEVKTDIYPNPVQDVLTLQLVSSTTDYKEISYTIYDSFDRVVIEKNLGVIPANTFLEADVSQLPKGLYLFRVTTDGSSSIKKFIKN